MSLLSLLLLSLISIFTNVNKTNFLFDVEYFSLEGQSCDSEKLNK